MMVGRASHEVVQVKSILYPWARSPPCAPLTIERHYDNEISRYDSGWSRRPQRNARHPAGITVHPGAVTGAFNIRQIQDTTQTYTSPAAAQLTGVYFDADIEIAGVTTGARPGGLRAEHRPVSGSCRLRLWAARSPRTTWRPWISRQGSLGGPVNCVVAIAGTRQTMRVSRIEVDNALQTRRAADARVRRDAARGSVAAAAGQPGGLAQHRRWSAELTPVGPDLVASR